MSTRTGTPTSTPAVPGTSTPATPGTVALTGTFARLKLALLRNGLRQSAGRRALFVTAAVLVALFAAAQLLGLVLLRGHDHAGALAVCLVGLLALGWAFLPLFFPGGDETLDPTRLVMLPLRPRSTVTALLLTSVIGIGPLFTVAMVAGAVVAAGRGAAAGVVAVVAGVLAVLVCLALARAVATANVGLLTSRKGRDLALLSGLLVAVGVQAVNLGIQRLSGPGSGLDVLEPIARVLRWVPPASAVDAVGAAGDGAWGRAALGLGLTAAALALLLWWWERGLTKLMTAPDSSTLRAAEPAATRGGGPGRGAWAARLLPADRSGPVMVRSLRYAWRDPKTRSAWASGMGVGLLIPVVTVVQGGGSIYVACWASGMLGLQMYNQFGQDYSGFWLVASTISGREDAYLELRGRALALLAVAVPFVVLVVVGGAALVGDWAALPEALGIALALLGALVATGAPASVRLPYSVPQDSGFRNAAPGQGALAGFSIFAGMIVGALLCAPVVALTVWLHVADLHGWLWLVLPLGAGYAWLLVAGALRLAAPQLARRLPEILAAVSR
ncbi:transporter [Streptomyces polyrhachis]|uniref:Transporter n=1 Tax=Streptomyces polyrhachis TaxID=1282885 RepID=A0ABW2GGF5_9ACTN